MSNIKFTGIMPALITPFNEDGSIKVESVQNLMDWQLSKGVNGFYICGSTGEGPVLNTKTRMEMGEVTVEHIRERGVIIDHVGAPCIEDTIALIKHATQTGVNAISSLAPTFFFNYTDDELVNYYKTISSYTDLPVLVYATRLVKSPDIVKLLTRLMEIPNIIGVKFTRRDYFELRKVKEINGGDINLINGPDETLICGLVMGANGGIGTTYNIMPDLFVKLYTSFTSGDYKTAQECQYKINRIIAVLLKHGENGAIKSTKAALELMGYDIGYAVFPAKHYSMQEKQALKADLISAGLKF